jgi:hypothetical protein
MNYLNDPFGILTNVDYDELMSTFNNLNTLTTENLQNLDTCKQCGNNIQKTLNNITNVCETCGVITDTQDDCLKNTVNNNRLRIVGFNSSHFQPDLYRSDSGNSSMLQKKQILSEYKEYRQKFIELGERAFPLNACEIATEFYNKIQQQCVKRSQNKKAIMAACLWQACLIIDFAPSKIEISKFMQLPHKGIARGNNFIRTMISNKQLDIDPNVDPIYPEIRTLFIQMEFTDDVYKNLHTIIWDIIQIAIKNSIGINSLPRSKVIGTTYIVLKRCQDKVLVPNPPLNTKEFCKNKIRKNTIDRYIGEINSYHSYFVDYYKSVNLFSESFL